MANPLRVVYDSAIHSAEKSVPEIDIVAVHGLNFKGDPSHAENTWTKNDQIWLRDFLPEALSNPARVMLFSYNSSPAIDSSNAAVEDHANSLLQALSLNRQVPSHILFILNGKYGELASRPLVFVCHSLGGIVVKSALVEATLNTQYTAIRESTRLLVFFATPHQGGNHSGFGDVVAKVARFGLQKPNNNLINALRKGSEIANARFRNARHLFQTCLIVSFFETKALHPSLGIIVDRESATLNFPGNMETLVAMDANHSAICKFDSADTCTLVTGTIAQAVGRALKPQCVRAVPNTAGNKHWLVPRAPHRFFTGRERVIGRIKEAITLSNVTQQRRFVVTGMGGQGKSEVCLRVSSDLRDRFWAVFWVDVCDTTTAGGSFSKVAKMLGSASNDMDGALTSLANLSHEQSWLLILDNADDPHFDYSRYLPSGDRGAVIMTSRNPECGRAHQTVGWEELDNLDPDDCVELLMKAAKIPREPDSTLRTDAESVIEAVGSHTLAILQAGAYIARGHCKMAAYPEVLNRNRKRLMQFHPKQEQSRYQNAYTTLEASMQVIEHSADDETSQDAYYLLNFLSVFHYENFPLAVLQSAWEGAHWAHKNDTDEQAINELTPHHAAKLPQYLSTESEDWDSFRLVQALDLLESLALVKKIDLGHEHSSVSMHPLAHSWANIRQTDEQARQSLLLSECIFALAVYSTYANWQPWYDQFRTHALRLLHAKAGPDSLIARAAESRYTLQICTLTLDFLDTLRLDNPLRDSLNDLFGLLTLDPAVPTREFWPLYRMAAKQAREQGNYEAAIRIFRALSKSQNETPLESDSLTSKVLHELATSYLYDGQIKNAINIFEEVVRIRESVLDNTHPNRLNSQHELARAYLANGRIQDAIDIFEEVVRIEKNILDNTHPDRLISQHELAGAYLANGRIQDAIDIFEEVIRIRENVLDNTHPDRLSSQHELARAYLANGRIQDAIDIFEEVVRIRENILDNTHPDRLSSQHELARAYLANGRIQDAIDIFEEVVRIKENILDNTHPDRLSSQHELARAYLANGRIQDAIDIFEEVVRIRENVLDNTHPDRLSSQHELARAYSEGRQFRKAMQLLEYVESIRRTCLDEKHPSRLVTEHTLGVAYMEVGRVADAIQLLEHVDRVEAETLDENHPDRILTRKALEKAYRRRDNGFLEAREGPSASSPSENECQCDSSSEPPAAWEALEDDIEDEEKEAWEEVHGGEVQSTHSSLSAPDGEASQQGGSGSVDVAAPNESRSRPRLGIRALASRLKGKMKAPRMTR